ncbi:hypothetical protein K32_18040 [Kaistia sp. 32K]|uniref:hypothetical protein n=1 Tax=Kaistia sp. 32K TaxID=2795690 RepID=UPI0019167924|nr:hypothetical protein [Kaistia sp. 32K]BCP53187.1 hypothetical protein K32_18040 [Kaistia sp. 32K]
MSKRSALGGIAAGLILALAGPAAAEALQPVKIRYCHGYGCRMKSPVTFSVADLNALKRILDSGRGSAAAERAAISRADQWYERKAGAQTGTSSDRAKGDFGVYTPLSQLDCVDEMTNTTTLLKLLARHGWLRHHTVGPSASRGVLFDGRYPHNTATIVETATGKRWVVDSWVRANAEPPDIKPLDVWKREGGRRG